MERSHRPGRRCGRGCGTLGHFGLAAPEPNDVCERTKTCAHMEALLIILGAVLATAGGCIGHYFAAKLSHDADKWSARREQLERLATLVVSIDDWLEKLKQDVNADSPRHTESDPTTLICMLVTLYLPEVRDEAAEFCCAVTAYAQDIRLERLKRLQPDGGKSGRLKTLEEVTEEVVKRQKALYEPMIKAQVKLLDALRSIALSIDN